MGTNSGDRFSGVEFSCGSVGDIFGELDPENNLGDENACAKLLRRLVGLDPPDEASSWVKIFGGVGKSGVLDPENILILLTRVPI